MSSDYDFGLASRFHVSLDRVGNEQEPVLTVEGLLRNPGALIEYAEREVSFSPAWGPQGGYPGVRAPAPLNYVRTLVEAIDPLIRRGFDLAAVKLARAECNFSLVTLPPDQLKPLQRIPHVDTTDPLQFAILHFLCNERFGGTAFYRHRATGFETLTPERDASYDAVRALELEAMEARAGYIIGDSDHYQQTAAFNAAYNRLLIYRSRTFHSGLIGPEAPLSDQPRSGRLTANIFLNYRPVG